MPLIFNHWVQIPLVHHVDVWLGLEFSPNAENTELSPSHFHSYVQSVIPEKLMSQFILISVIE